MWKRAEHQLGRSERDRFRDGENEVSAGDAHSRTAPVVRRCEVERERRMSKDECTELAARISAGPEHADWCFIHA